MMILAQSVRKHGSTYQSVYRSIYKKCNHSTRSKNLDVIKEQFAHQAKVFEKSWDSRCVSSNEEIMARVMAHVQHILGKNAKPLKALDVACGTGIFTRTLSSHCDQVLGLDVTPEMLAEAKAATNDTKTNISYIIGDGAALPFLDSSFDLIASRLAVHHFDQPLDQVKEMRRVCKEGVAVVIVDIVCDDNPVISALQNHLEVLRDPSHTRMLTSSSISELLSSAGLKVFTEKLQFDNILYVDKWLQSTRTPENIGIEIINALQLELTKGEPITGMQPFEDTNGRLCFIHKYEVVVAEKI